MFVSWEEKREWCNADLIYDSSVTKPYLGQILHNAGKMAASCQKQKTRVSNRMDQSDQLTKTLTSVKVQKHRKIKI